MWGESPRGIVRVASPPRPVPGPVTALCAGMTPRAARSPTGSGVPQRS